DWVSLGQALTPSVKHMLDSLASQASDLVWKIDRDVVLGYLESGGSAKELSELLDTYAADGVPEQVRTFLADMTRKAQACRSSEEALLIELADVESAAEIANDSRTSKLCRLVGTNEVVVRKRNLKAFQNALRKMGYVLPQ
ncbi:MAG: helicase-associated domain-containing protein, partial [Deltaproteobacteria bacterium]|nr:helicase-associated domain-containing protein [Deltaproteobacteria bacterium]